MKRMILFLFLPLMGRAQFLDQKATQVRYLEQQISALGQYLITARHGYQIVQQGLSAVKGFTQGELDLHTAFFSRLEWVNPAVLNPQPNQNATSNLLPAALPARPSGSGPVGGSGATAPGRQ